MRSVKYPPHSPSHNEINLFTLHDFLQHYCENGQKSNGKVTILSDQKERKQNIENEHTELKVPLNQEETEAGVNIFNIT